MQGTTAFGQASMEEPTGIFGNPSTTPGTLWSTTYRSNNHVPAEQDPFASSATFASVSRPSGTVTTNIGVEFQTAHASEY